MRISHDRSRTTLICILAMLAVLVVPVAAHGQLVADWQMDEPDWSGAGGEVTDSSGSGNNGTARGQDTVPTTVDGQVCRAGDFRGQGFNLPEPPWYVNAQHFVEIPDSDSLSPLAGPQEAMTIGGWFQARSLSGGTLIHKGEGSASQEYRVFIRAGRLQLQLWDRFGSAVSTRISDEPLVVDTWYFFSVSIERLGNSPNMRAIGYLYDTAGAIGGPRDEVLQNLRYNNKPLDGNVFIGGISYGGQPVDFYDGLLDELRIYSSVRTQAEIEAHRAATRPCPGPTELLVEYRMEQAGWTGTIGEVADTSGNERDATPVGGTSTVVVDPALPGNPGTCRYGEFDGVDDGLGQPGAWLEGLSAITVMAWTYNSAPLSGNERGVFFTSPTGPGRDNRLGLRYDNAGFFGGGTNVIKASVSTTACPDNDECVQIETSSGLMVRDQWQHLAMTWEAGGDLKVFVDGVQAATSAEQGQGTGGVIDAVSALNIGQGAKGQRWQGRIDEFRVFRGALSAAEISDERDRTFPCEAQAIEHIRLLHSGTGLTCRAEAITIQACADAACSSLLSDEISVTLTSPGGNWSVNPVTFTGSTSVSLLVPTPDPVTLNASSNPAANSPTRCFSGGMETCSMEWFESGFIIDVPDHVSATAQPVSISAVRTDDTDQTCAPAFADETRTVGFWSEYENPNSGALPAVLDGTPIATGSPGTGIEVAFDGNSVGSLQLAYADAGQVRLRARYEGSGQDTGLVMIGSDAFVARPSSFVLTVPGNPSAGDASGPVFRAASVPFEIETAAINAVGDLTPNFGRETPPESVALNPGLVAPAGGAIPPLGGALGRFGEDCQGDPAPGGTACGDFSWPEVGIVEIFPRLASGSYLGTADVTGELSEPVGRFIPSHFSLAAGVLTDRVELSGCSDDFTYIGELFGADWTLDALNAGGFTTENYDGAFAKLGPDAMGIAGDQPINIDFSSLTWINGFGTASARISIDRSAPVEPYEEFRIGIAPRDSDGVELAVLDIDLSADGSNDHGLIGETELRYGRIELDNTIGSELGPLILPLRAEYFEESTWKINTLDECTALSLSDHVELTSSNGDTENGAAVVGIGSGSTSIQESDPVTLSEGTTGFTFSAPGSTGWVDLMLLLDSDWPFLRNDLDDDGNFLENPSARASFGLFDGNKNRILLQEILPQ